MATLSNLLVRATKDPHVVLDAQTQRAMWQLSAHNPSLRAALAACPQLIPELREQIAIIDEVETRRAFLARPDLTDAEIAATVASERRTTVLLGVAEESLDPAVLTKLATKGGKRLRRALALNPATPEADRLRCSREMLDGEIDYKSRSIVQLLLAECEPVRRYVLCECPSLSSLALALPLLPLSELDTGEVLDRALALLAEHSGTPYDDGYSELFEQVATLKWMFSPEQMRRLEDLHAGHERWTTSNWRSHRLQQLAKMIQQPAAQLEAEFRQVADVLELVTTSEDTEQLASVDSLLASFRYGGARHGLYNLVVVLALIENESAPIETLVTAVTRAGWDMRRRLSMPSRRSPRSDLALMATTYEPDAALVATCDIDAVFAIAAQAQFWPTRLVENLLLSSRMTEAHLSLVPLSSLPDELPSSAVQALVAQLGPRTQDPSWLEAALSLSSDWEGRLTDLVSLVDCV